jgi:hypothetical protein
MQALKGLPALSFFSMAHFFSAAILSGHLGVGGVFI